MSSSVILPTAAGSAAGAQILRRSDRSSVRRRSAAELITTTAAAAAADADATEGKKKVVILGGGIIGCSIAYFLSKRGVASIIVERTAIAAAASGKSGGFLAGGWGDGTATQALHRESFKLHEQLADELELRTYRKIPTLSVAGGASFGDVALPVSWLDGDVARADVMDEATAQVTPMELTTRLHEEAMKMSGAETIYGEVMGIRLDAGGGVGSARKVSGVEIIVNETGETRALDADVCVVAMGPWSTRASQWFDLDVPMTGIKSVSLVYDANKAVADEPAVGPPALPFFFSVFPLHGVFYADAFRALNNHPSQFLNEPIKVIHLHRSIQS